MIAVVTWGIIVTVIILSIETSHLKRFNDLTKRIIKLETLLEHGKERKETKESEASKAERRGS
jgi:hypothetical protein